MELLKSLLPLDLQYFAEENKDQAEPPAAEPKNPDTPEPPKDEVKTIPYDRFKQVNDDLKSFKSTFEELGIDGVDSLKALVEDYNAKKTAEEERKRSEMTELERLQNDLKAKEEAEKTLAQQLEDLQKANEREKIRNEFIKVATSNDIAYIDDALALADLSAVKVEDGKVVGVEDVVKTLVDNKPFLVKKKAPKPIGQSSNGSDTGASEKTAEQLLEEAAQRAKHSGRPEDKVAYAKLKRELSK
ncbi:MULTISPECIES: Clp protease ClpB [Bacillus]|uniref:phage scaffolding protein n=1 Tax=Bacillus TaxID=1386 RepID=UPI00158165D4|nr:MULTISPECIES: Clp protease ClpB [Bacillus]MDU0071751.1 Clp protease ClpB [Bacillus sp. IG6]MEC1426630.1 Clp protease ClpB [Bacillus sonorensis]MED8019912.1 Clp protease ClpB [Bacillus glycinifermentans]NUJ19554.1 Clp protease ClpB [Bacillus glycinifermentans]